MRHHYTAQPLIDKSFERIQFQAIQSLPGKRDDRQVMMGIYRGVPMTRKMFSVSQNSGAFHTFHEGDTFLDNILTVLTKRAISNNRIFRIGIDIQIGCKINVYAQSIGMLSYLKTDFLHNRTILDGAQGHIPRKGIGRIESHGQSPFRIHPYQQRNF